LKVDDSKSKLDVVENGASSTDFQKAINKLHHAHRKKQRYLHTAKLRSLYEEEKEVHKP
jgi:hypothetical protein